ncbi:structural maintenance of chromosomes protein 1, putative [Plasmodium malariae]|uniref:Structural maintenance of chromosomes protein 1, putative n=1 Tax=Plasmodium malariae TaxID=5858 RepID=A0A1D3PC13_PLAMA|nr:structural maintenance of chromosomes protein 1, putative [Plasmodium malariae]SCN12824.1 structural maintenance of chromosomes protein 1, putative [Plasmodium malariae]
MPKKDKKKLDDLSDSSNNDDQYESSLDIVENEDSNTNNLIVNSVKVVDDEFNNFINNEYSDNSDLSSLDFSNTNTSNLKNGKEKKYSILKGIKSEEKSGIEVNKKKKNNNNNKSSKGTTLVDNRSKKNLAQHDLEENHLNIDIHMENEEENTFEKEKNLYERSPFWQEEIGANCTDELSEQCKESGRNMDKHNKDERNEEVRSESENNNISHSNNEGGKPDEDANANQVCLRKSRESCSTMNFSNNFISKNRQYEQTNNTKMNDLSISNDYLNSSIISSTLYKENELCFIKYLIVCNFKSYENENIIGPFSKFTAIIGPNGSGKSNIMDCICFVLGINNKYLRVKNMKSLIYHKENEKMENFNKRKCYVKLILQCNKENVEIKRTLNYRGASHFFINDKLVDHNEYMSFLRKNRIETKTKTCLIFQGDIEEIINKKPTELSKLFEYISGSNEYEQIYEDIKEKLKEKQIACKNYLNEKKKIEQEIKIHKTQIDENVEHNQLKEDYENDIRMLYLFRLYHYHKKKENYKEDLLTFKEEKIEFEQVILSKNKKIANELEKSKLLIKKEFQKIEDQIRNHKIELNEIKIILNEINEKKKFTENALNKILANEKIKQNIQLHCSKFIDNLNEQLKEQYKKLDTEYRNKLKVNLKFFNKYDQVKKFVKDKHTQVYHLLMKGGNCCYGGDPYKYDYYDYYYYDYYYYYTISAIATSSSANPDDHNSGSTEEMLNMCNVFSLIESLEEYKKCKERYLYLCANSNININNYCNLASTLKKDVKELQEECDNYSRKKQKELLDYESEKVSLDELRDRTNKLNYLIEENKKNIDNGKKKLKEWNTIISSKEKQLEQLDEEVNVLNIHKNELLFFEKKKEVIKNLKTIFGDDEIYDEVCNLYEINNQMYYIAVNNIIHKYNNYLVVKNIQSCIKCIQYLKDNKLHKIDFIPFENFVTNLQKKKKKKKEKKYMNNLHIINSSIHYEQDNNDHVEEEDNRDDSSYDIIEKVMNDFKKKKNIVLANNCLVCDANYKILFDYLIGENTLIVERIKDAEEIKSKFPYLNVNIVTLNGHIISKNNNLIIDISSKYADKEKYSNRRLNINIYNKLINEKEECRNSINECNKKIIETNELISKQNSEIDLNKKKLASILIKRDIFEKEIEAKTAIIDTYEDKINKLKNVDIKKKLDSLHNYEKELLKERNSLCSYQKESFQNLNIKFSVDNIYEIVEYNMEEIEKIDEHIDRINNNIKKLNDDINELLDKRNEVNLVHGSERDEDTGKNGQSEKGGKNGQNGRSEKYAFEQEVKKELEALKQEENKSVSKIKEINSIINELENKKITFLKNLNTINQELNDLRESINNNFEKYETIESNIENSKKKIEIYTQFIRDLINECDMNSINIFLTSNVLKDMEEEPNHRNAYNTVKKGKKNPYKNNKGKTSKTTSKMNRQRKSKLLMDSEGDEETNTSISSNGETRSSLDDDNDDDNEQNNEEDTEEDMILSNISFDVLSDELKHLDNDKDIHNETEKMEKEIERKKKFLKLRNVNSNAEKEYEKLTAKLKAVDTCLSEERKECNLFERNFRILQKKRSYKFLHCFNYIKNIIDNVYNNLTYNIKHHVGGQAFLDLCNYNEFNKDDEPFYCGIKYNNMPPMKRYFEISELSGGEKSISALALIFSIQKYINNSFIILDEVDANMDPIKINSLTRYLNSINSQVIVISLKEKFFSKSQTLIGVYKNKHKKSSKTVTLDISKYRTEVTNG